MRGTGTHWKDRCRTVSLDPQIQYKTRFTQGEELYHLCTVRSQIRCVPSFYLLCRTVITCPGTGTSDVQCCIPLTTVSTSSTVKRRKSAQEHTAKHEVDLRVSNAIMITKLYAMEGFPSVMKHLYDEISQTAIQREQCGVNRTYPGVAGFREGSTVKRFLSHESDDEASKQRTHQRT